MNVPRLPSVVRGKVLHQRRTPFPHGLRFTTYQWLIDLDAIPTLPLARFHAGDHFGGTLPLREATEAFAAANGAVRAPGDRLLMLSTARSLGHVFNPLTVYWCITPDGGIRWAILEIHNTYGQRHAHVVWPDAAGNATLAKEFYVSPFFTVDGEYRVRLQLAEDRVLVSVNLHQGGALAFSSSFTGTPRPATLTQRIAAAVRTPLSGYQTTVRIRIHGIWLWLRRLPVVPRPTHPQQTGMS